MNCVKIEINLKTKHNKKNTTVRTTLAMIKAKHLKLREKLINLL